MSQYSAPGLFAITHGVTYSCVVLVLAVCWELARQQSPPLLRLEWGSWKTPFDGRSVVCQKGIKGSAEHLCCRRVQGLRNKLVLILVGNA